MSTVNSWRAAFELVESNGGWLLYVRRWLAGLSVATLAVAVVAPLWHVSPATRSPEASPLHPADSAGTPPRGLEDYQRVMAGKTLFQSGFFQPTAVAAPRAPRVTRPAVVAPAAPTLAQLVADLQLVGVLNDGAEAAISSKKTQETTYVRAGGHVGDLTVTSIRSNAVTLSYQGQSMDLSL